MFKIAQSATFKAPVKFEVLDADGKKTEIEFTGVFRRHTQAEVAQLVDSAADDRAVAHKALAGWENGPADESDVPLPFSAENLDRLIDGIDGIKTVIARTFFQGNSAATRKN